MKREFLTGELGLSKAVTDKIMAQHGLSVSGLKSELEQLKNENADYVGQIETLTAQAEEFGSMKQDLESKAKDMDALTKERDGLKTKLSDIEIEHEIGKTLAKLGAKNLTAASALIDKGKIQKTDEGYFGIREQAERIKAECGYLFYDGLTATGMRHSPTAQSTDSFTQFARAGAKLN